MNSIKRSCHRNNEGVCLLTCGDTQGAMVAFQDAIGGVKELVDKCGEASSSSKMAPAMTAEFASLQSATKLVNLRSDYSYIYDRPLHLYPPNDPSMICDSLLSFYSAGILFNLALASHLFGRTSGNERSIKRATVLYRMCLQLVQNCSDFGTAPRIMALLALNNRAQIHYEYCDYPQSRHCLKEMSKMLADSSFLQDSLSDSDVEGLLLNVMLTQVPTAAQAA